MSYFSYSPIFLVGLLVSSLSHAEVVEANGNIELEDSGHLKSLQQLQSLKHLPQYQNDQTPYVQELKNTLGIRSLFVEAQALPIVDIQLTFNAGAARDQYLGKDLYGIANMAANLIDEGTNQYSAEQIANTFEQLGAKFSAHAYRDMFVIRLRVLSDPEKLNPAVNLMLNLISNATFNSSGLNLVLSNTQVGQKQLQENPDRLKNIELYRAIYGEHPYAHPITGTTRSIRKITPDLLKKFRDSLLVAQNMNLAITGQLTQSQASQLTEKITQSLPQGQAVGQLPDADLQPSFNIRLIPYQSSQAYVSIGHLGISRNNPDQLALEVANQMLGGHGFNSILMQELRVKRGYTYGAYSSFSFTQAPGVFNLSYSTRQDQLLDSIQVAHKALVDFVKQPIDTKQLEETKAGMLRSFPMSFSSNANINAQLGSIGFYGLPADHLAQYAKQLNKITAQDVQQAVKKYIHPDRLTIVIAGEPIDQTLLEKMLRHNLDTTHSILP
ncbi:MULTISPECIES: M16 family metallopeptidase [Acinetobacter]|uniref:Putative Zinc protease putative signal peptide n=1 Tax=Acinetobacter baylyi (strain ATCC 33305 / BD413 / ADP1) TaxID=62977 RepID=Q6FA29_ACIAD|nr:MULTISPECIES: pitrilysin family protein [Acinetobacter]ENV54022.1 hypothetical protein F952_02077 [Acinetobacter baylyi DSM 14961 = CIP 107474]KAF2372942.1 peptidase M16 [Acinetobacter baylyi]KAF2375463.1 peptidase M16 [Acinetobacter baylyi]KAF2376143.1 peptidase M16 [Acinetobacter baylyi]KAF2382892.1 peptidase M16 [Acinetobacter baylyi]